MPAADERRARRAAHRRMLGCDGLSRGQRFALRIEGREAPGFDLIAAPPAWRVAEVGQRRELALLTALLHHRPAIDAELHGPALARLAALVGEARFDAVCEAALDGLPLATARALPPPGDLESMGSELLHRAASEPPFAALSGRAAELLAASPVTRRREAA